MKRLFSFIPLLSLIGFVALQFCGFADAADYAEYPGNGRWEGLTRLYDPKYHEGAETHVSHKNDVQEAQTNYYASRPMQYLNQALRGDQAQ